ISGPLSIAALLSGDVDYSGAGGSGMRAAIKGAPVKGIMFQADKVTFYLVADPSIRNAADLKGKRIAIGSPGDTQDRVITMFAERGGVSSRDIIRISMGADTNTRVIAVKTGAAQATTVDPGGLVFAQKEGLVSLGFLGDLSLSHAFSRLRHYREKNPGKSRANKKVAQRSHPRSDVRAGKAGGSSGSRNQKTSARHRHQSHARRGDEKLSAGFVSGSTRPAHIRRYKEFPRVRHQDPAADQRRDSSRALAQLAACRRSTERAYSRTKETQSMTSEKDLREQLATCTRIFAMQGMIGVFGHVSVYQPSIKQVLITPGMGSDKGNLHPEDMVPTDLDGKPLEGSNGPPVEWPIHTALHGARADALAVAHLHTPYATLFAIAKREFRPGTLQGAIFSDGVTLYPEAQLITTPARGNSLLKVIGDKRAALLRGHGIVVVGQNLQEVLYTSLVLEDDTKKTLQAVTLGEIGTISPEECRAFGAEIALERRAQRAWNYFCSLEARWDRQPATGRSELFPESAS